MNPLTTVLQEEREKLNEYSTCKSWELDKDKFFIDATPDEIKKDFSDSHRAVLAAVVKELEARKVSCPHEKEECVCDLGETIGRNDLIYEMQALLTAALEPKESVSAPCVECEPENWKHKEEGSTVPICKKHYDLMK